MTEPMAADHSNGDGVSEDALGGFRRDVDVLLQALPYILTVILLAGFIGKAIPPRAAQVWPWLALLLGGVILWFTLRQFPVTIWNPEEFALSPATYALARSQGTLQLPPPVPFESSAAVAIIGTLDIVFGEIDR